MMKHQTRIIIASMMGNLIEAFDLGICGLLSIYLAKYLIADTNKGLVLVFFTFFAGYLARPFGAVVMGLLSDIYGRKRILAASILCMGVATCLIGFIPSFETLGGGSLAFLLLLRIVQSFCCGAEFLNSSAYLVENADATKKGFFGSWASFGTMAGFMFSSIASLIVAYFVSIYPELEWAIWRVPFILALLGSSIGLYIRLCIPESLEYIIFYAEHPKPKIKGLFRYSFRYIRDNKLKSLYVFILSCLGVATTFQIYIYSPTQAHMFNNFTDQQIIFSNIFSLIIMLSVFPLVGLLSDRIKREKIVIIASLGFLILSQPLLYSLSYGNYGQLLFIQAIISIPAGAYYATVPVMLAEMFPLTLRCTVLSFLYSTAASLAAGLTPLLSLVLLKKTESSISPSILIITLALLAMGVMRLYLSLSQNNKMVPATKYNGKMDKAL